MAFPLARRQVWPRAPTHQYTPAKRSRKVTARQNCEMHDSRLARAGMLKFGAVRLRGEDAQWAIVCKVSRLADAIVCRVAAIASQNATRFGAAAVAICNGRRELCAQTLGFGDVQAACPPKQGLLSCLRVAASYYYYIGSRVFRRFWLRQGLQHRRISRHGTIQTGCRANRHQQCIGAKGRTL